MTKALFFSLGTCIVRRQSVRVNLACTRNFSISQQKWLSLSALPVCAPGAQYSFWRSNKFLFLVVRPRGLHIWGESKINSRSYFRFLLSWQVVFQQREMQISWRLCNNADINLPLCKVWSPVVFSQSSFHVTRADTDEKNRQNTFFCQKRWTCYPINNCSLMSQFNQTSIERKKCVWTTKYKRLLEMCIVQHAEIKSVFTFQPLKRPVSTTVESAKPASTFWTFLLRSKNRQVCCLVVMVHLDLQERRAATTEKENNPFFWRNFSLKHNQRHPNLRQKRQKSFHLWYNRVDTSLVDTDNQKFICILIFMHFQSTVKQNDFLSLQRRFWVVYRVWAGLSDFDCKRNRPRYDNKLPLNFSGSLELFVVSKTRVLKQPSNGNSS